MQTTEGAKRGKKMRLQKKMGTVEMKEAAEKKIGRWQKRERKHEKKYSSAEVPEMMQSMEEYTKTATASG